jgi:outer membrane murein-binding lipoprotein Lpp
MLRFIAVFVGIACLVGCTSAPVQEMSDARQAIAAARVAGATEVTSPDLYAAQAAITRAEKHLDAQEYTRARLAAMEAKHHAGAALTGAQRAEAQHEDAEHDDARHADSPPIQPP